jgi:hypothetical protein
MLVAASWTASFHSITAPYFDGISDIRYHTQCSASNPIAARATLFMHNAIPRLWKSGVLLNLLPVVVICWWIFVVFPRIGVVVEEDPFHPALVGFHAPEQSGVGIYRWSAPGALFRVPEHTLPGIFSFIGVPAPDGTRVAFSFPGSSFRVELPQNNGSMPLRRYFILWPDHVTVSNEVFIPIEVNIPQIRAESREIGLLVKRIDIFPVDKSINPSFVLFSVLLLFTQFLYFYSSYLTLNLSLRRSSIYSFLSGILVSLIFIFVPLFWFFWIVVFVFFIGSLFVFLIFVLRENKRKWFYVSVISFLILGLISFLLSPTSFLGCLISIPVGILSYLFFIFKNKLLLSALVCLVFITILVNGVGFEPDRMYQKSSRNPFVAHFDRYGDNYWQENILMQMMIYYARFFDYEYYLFLFFVILTAYIVILLLFKHHYGEYLSLITTSVLATSQLTTVAFSWLGNPDSLTILLTIPFFFIKSPIAIAVLATIGATNHLSHFIAAFMIMLTRKAEKEGIGFQHFASLLSGSLLGYLLVRMFLYYHSIPLNSRIDIILSLGLLPYIEAQMVNFPMTMISLFGVHWLIIPVSFLLYRRDRYFYVVSLIILLMGYSVTLFFFDTTRVFQLVSWGFFVRFLIRSYFLSHEGRERRVYTCFLIAVVILSLVLPRFYSCCGVIWKTPFTRMF